MTGMQVWTVGFVLWLLVFVFWPLVWSPLMAWLTRRQEDGSS